MNLSGKLPKAIIATVLAGGVGMATLNQERVQTRSCGCGDICMRNGKVSIGCKLSGCAREHGKPALAQGLLIEEDLNHLKRAAIDEARRLEKWCASHRSGLSR